MFKPEFILAFHIDAFKKLQNVKNGFTTEIPHLQLVSDYQQYLTIRQRNHLDHCPNIDLNDESAHTFNGDRNYRQILPYTVLAWAEPEGTQLSVYRRSVRVGEARLAGDVSIGYGGHVDLDDVASMYSQVLLGPTLNASTIRELDEEVLVADSNGARLFATDLIENLEYLGVILDDSNDVGKLHMGILQVLWLPKGSKVSANTNDGLEDLQSYGVTELLTSGLPLENWTRIALQQLT